MAIYNNDRDPNEMDWEKQNTKEYRIIESRPATYYWEYIVEAENEQAALDKILDGNVEVGESWVEEDDSDESDYEIYLNDDN